MTLANDRSLVVRLSGPLNLSWDDGSAVTVRTQKARAILAILAASPNHMRSRAWLQSTLWGGASESQGRASLRQALSLIRAGLAPDADNVLSVTGDTIALREMALRVLRNPAEGAFLEGVEISENGFEDWLRAERTARVKLEEVLAPGGENNVRPRIAVLPFHKLPLAEDKSLLGDAMAEELLRILSRLDLVDVISHLSSRSIDANRPTATDLREKLGCNYVVTGGYRQIGGSLRLEAEFHDTLSNTHLSTFACELNEAGFLAGDSQGMIDLAGNILRETLVSSVRLGALRPLPDLATHRLLMSAIGLMFKMGDADFGRAGRHLTEVIDRAPRHAFPLAWMAQWHLLRVFQGLSDDPAKSRKLAVDAVNRALDLDPFCAFSLAIDGDVQTILEADFGKARARFDLALEMDPNNATAHQFKAVLQSFLGEGDDAVRLTERARMLSPRDPRQGFFNSLGAAAYLVKGDYDTAVEMAENALKNSPSHVSAHRARVVGLALSDRGDKARIAARELMAQEPKLTIKRYLTNHPAADMPSVQTWARALESAGVPAV